MKMFTHSGRLVDPLNMAEADVCIEDIAHALANTCRYNGHCDTYYSVAQHAFLMSEYAPPSIKWPCLHHDDTEAYLGDMVRPIKHGTPIGAMFQEIEVRLHEVIFRVFGIDMSALDDVDRWDSWMLAWEQRDLVTASHADGWWYPHLMGTLPTLRLVPWSPGMAEAQFLAQYRMLTQGQAELYSSQAVGV